MAIFVAQGDLQKSAIQVNKGALLKDEGLKQNDLFSAIKRNAISASTVKVIVYNIIIRIRNNAITEFRKTQIKTSDSTCKIT